MKTGVKIIQRKINRFYSTNAESEDVMRTISNNPFIYLAQSLFFSVITSVLLNEKPLK